MTENYLNATYGVQIPKIIYGTAWKKCSTASFVEQAIKQGFRGIDTACQPKHYNEAGVGDGLYKGVERNELYLQTKFTPLNGQDPLQIPYDPKASLGEQIAQSFQTSLKNLRTVYLDCLILHSPLGSHHLTLEAWRAMEQLFHANGVRQLGISNCYDLAQLEQLYQDATIKPAVIQNRFYATTDYDRTIRNFCRQHQIVYQSFWTLTANPHVLAHSTLQSLATKYQKSTAQIFFRFLNQIDIVPLTGTTSETHMREDLAIFDFELTDQECTAIEKLL